MPAPFVLSSDLVSAYPAKSVTLADYIDTSLASKTDLAMTQNAQTGTSYSYALADASKLLTMSNAASNTVTVTKQATVTWVTGTQLRIMNLGAGVTTLVADTGVTINGNVSLKQYQGGTLIRTASDVWLFVPTASSSGMDLITPTSVAGTGVTLSGGQVSFSAATEVDVNGCFTSAYENYALVITATASATVFNSFRMRLAGSNAVGATDYTYGLFFVNGTPNSGALTNSTGASAGSIGYIGTERSVHNLTIAQPALAAYTAITGLGLYTLNASTTQTIGTTHRLNTAYDGFAIIPASGNITGTLRVYGLRNS
jgi:hypothetical protein